MILIFELKSLTLINFWNMLKYNGCEELLYKVSPQFLIYVKQCKVQYISKYFVKFISRDIARLSRRM